MRGSGAFRTSAVPGGALAGPWVRNPLWRNARAVPSFDLQLANNKSLVDGVTGRNLVSFARASSATFVGSDGLLKTAVTNLLLQSEAIDNTTNWNRIAGGTGSAPVVNANAAIAPDGTTTADQVVLALNGGTTVNDSSYITQSYQSTSGLVYTVSIWLRTISGNVVIALDAESQNINTVTVTPVWQRFSFSRLSSTNGSRTARFGLRGTFGTADSATFYAWGAQLEQASTVGEYIPTVAAINSAPRFDHSVTSSTTNLVLRSEEFENASWTKTNSTITTNTVISPDGLITGDSITSNAGLLGHVVQNVSQITSTAYTFSAFAKADQYTFCQLRITGAVVGAITRAYFNLAAGTVAVATNCTASIAPVGNDWYRCSITYTTISTATASPRVYGQVDAADTVGDGTSGIYIWGAQMEQSSTMGPYVPTTTAAATSNNTESLGLLVEEARTNYLLQSQDFTTTWSQVNITTTANTTVSPDGGINADTLLINVAAAATGQTTQSFTAGSTITASVFAKKNASNFIRFELGSLCSCWFNLDTGVTATNNAGSGNVLFSAKSIQSFGGGWYRCSLTVTTTTITTLGVSIFATNADNTTSAVGSSVFLWGAQAEVGAFATSFIPTTTATAPRAADVASILGSNFGVTRTNLLIYSEDFNNATYTLTSATVSQNAVVAPNDFLTADTINASGTAVVSQSYTKAGSSITYTASLFVKGSVTDFSLTIDDGTATNRGRARFNLATGASGSILSEGTGFSDTSGTIVPFPNGWYRITVTTTTNTTTTARHRFFWTGGGTSVDVWGAQLEANSAATPYIPSTQTFTSRASGASYFDVAGVLQWKPQNLLTRSEEFENIAWTATNSTFTPNTIIAPNGTLTADKHVPNLGAFLGTGASDTRVFQTPSFVSGLVYTFSIYAKQGECDQIKVAVLTSPSVSAIYSLTLGTVEPPVAGATINDVGNGWYRCSLTFTATSTSAFQVRWSAFSSAIAFGDGVSGMFAWGAQLEQVAGSFATPGEYIPTLGTATGGARNSAYLPDSSGVLRSAGLLLLEEARTNLWQWSNSATDGQTWNNVGTHLTLTAGQTSPAGDSTAIRAADVDSATAGTFLQRTAVSPALTANTFVSYSIFIKPINIPNTIGVAIFANGTTDGVTGTFIVSGSAITGSNVNYNGTGASGSASHVAYPNGWYRVTVSGIPSTVTMADCRVRINLGSYARSTGTARFDWYGGQFENNAFASSYFPNTGTLGGVTRAADVSASTATSVFESSWYNQTEGTFFVESNQASLTPASRLISASDNTTSNRIILTRASALSGNISLTVTNAGTAQVAGVILGSSLAAGTSNKVAAGYKAADFAGSINGLTSVTQGTGTIPGSLTQLTIGNGDALGNNPMTGTIKRLVYWGQRLPNNVLQAITQ